MTHRLPLLFLIISLTKLEVCSFGIDVIKISENNRAQIECSVALLGKYFHSAEALSGSVVHMSITSASIDLQASLLHALHTESNYSWDIVVEDPQRESKTKVSDTHHILHHKPQCYFLIIESIENEDLDEIFQNWQTHFNWNPLAQFVVFLTTNEETEEILNELMAEVLLVFMNKKIFNVNIIGQSEENRWYFGKTVFPYHPDNNCGNRVITIETLDICDYQVGETENHYGGNENTNRTNEAESGEVIDTDGNANLVEYKQDVLKSNNYTIPSNYPKLVFKEIHRASFFDKIPKDLSGCPIVAGYRLWEPYIFNEPLDNSVSSAETDFSNQNYFNDTFGAEEDDADEYIVYNKQQNGNGKSLASAMARTTASVSGRCLSGIEFKMIQTIAERLHVSIEMQLENNNLYHLLQNLIDGDIEMIVGGIDEDPSLSKFVSSTVPHHQDELTWCVAKANHTHNLFNFLATFQTAPWLLTLLFILTASLSILMSQRLLELRLAFIQSYFRINICVIGIMLSQTISLRPPTPTSLKLCFGTIFVMGFMFGNVYHSFLVSTLTRPKTAYQISHLDEIYQNRMHVVGSVENVRHLNKEGEIYRYIRKNFKVCYNIEECLQQAVKDTNLAVAVSRQHYFYNPRIPRDNLYCFDRNENIYLYLVTILMPKKFHLLHKINPFVQHIIETGHMEKWTRDLETNRKIKEDTKRAHVEKFNSLTVLQVAGSFAFNGLLMAFALCLFLLEKAVHWLVVKRKIKSKFMKYIHKKLA